jgi:hypothetical protein
MASLYSAARVNLAHADNVTVEVRRSAVDPTTLSIEFDCRLAGAFEFTLSGASETVQRELHTKLGAALGIEAGGG